MANPSESKSLWRLPWGRNKFKPRNQGPWWPYLLVLLALPVVGYQVYRMVETNKQKLYATELTKTRKARLMALGKNEASPYFGQDSLPELTYFPARMEYQLSGRIYFYQNPTSMELEVTGAQQGLEYLPIGKVVFTLPGQPRPDSLVVFQPAGSPAYTNCFIPFRDATNGKTTYGLGRYLDVAIPLEAEGQIPESGFITMDFNLAYQPYCAHGLRLLCPEPPLENVLEVEIPAGERKQP